MSRRNKYLAPQHTIKAGVGPNGDDADGWWYGDRKGIAVYICNNDGGGCHWAKIPRRSLEAWLKSMRTDQPSAARPLSEWHEDDGPVLWWVFPVTEPPYCGTPIDAEWPCYHTHWTRIEVPRAVRGER